MLGTQQKQLFAGCSHGLIPFIFYLRGCSKVTENQLHTSALYLKNLAHVPGNVRSADFKINALIWLCLIQRLF